MKVPVCLCNQCIILYYIFNIKVVLYAPIFFKYRPSKNNFYYVNLIIFIFIYIYIYIRKELLKKNHQALESPHFFNEESLFDAPILRFKNELSSASSIRSSFMYIYVYKIYSLRAVQHIFFFKC